MEIDVDRSLHQILSSLIRMPLVLSVWNYKNIGLFTYRNNIVNTGTCIKFDLKITKMSLVCDLDPIYVFLFVLTWQMLTYPVIYKYIFYYYLWHSFSSQPRGLYYLNSLPPPFRRWGGRYLFLDLMYLSNLCWFYLI